MCLSTKKGAVDGVFYDAVFVVVSTEHVLKDIDSPYAVERAVYKIIEKEKERGMQK